MIFTASIFTDNTIMILAGALLWAFIVLSIDRYIVSSIDKGVTVYDDLVSFKFLIRLILAVGIGIAVSHPIVIYYFNDLIEEERLRQDKSQIDGIDRVFDRKEADLRKSNEPLLRILFADKARLEQEKLCAEALRQLETSGILGAKNKCGEQVSVYGAGKGPAYEAIGERIEALKTNLAAKEAEINTTRQRLNERIALARSEATAEASEIKKQFVNGYARRQEILDQLAAEDSGIWTTKFFILIFLIFVDVTPVLLKTLTPRGPYDKLKEHFNLHSISSGINYLKFVEEKDRKLTKTNLQLMVNATNELTSEGEKQTSERYDFPVLLHFLLKRQLITTYNLFHRIFDWQKTMLVSSKEVLPSKELSLAESKESSGSSLDKVLKMPYGKLIEASSPQKFIEKLVISLFVAALTFSFSPADSTYGKGLMAVATLVVTALVSVVFTKVFDSDPDTTST